jgi:hypothetical protein
MDLWDLTRQKKAGFQLGFRDPVVEVDSAVVRSSQMFGIYIFCSMVVNEPFCHQTGL